METGEMRLVELQKEHIKGFKSLMQEAFQFGYESYTKQKEDQVLPEKAIDRSLNDKNGHGFEMVDDVIK